jgi:hypothetical protein
MIHRFADQFAGFREIHHLASIYALLLDRIADGQVADKVVSEKLAHAFHTLLIQDLKAACRDIEIPITDIVCNAAIAIRQGAEKCGSALDKRAITCADYVFANSLKYALYSVPSLCLLHCLGMHKKKITLVNCFNLVMIAWQCIDDALDIEEDRRLHSIDFCEAMGYPAGSFVMAGRALINEAIAHCRGAGFPKISERLIQAPADRMFPEISAINALERMGGITLAMEILECWRQETALHKLL